MRISKKPKETSLNLDDLVVFFEQSRLVVGDKWARIFFGSYTFFFIKDGDTWKYDGEGIMLEEDVADENNLKQ